MAVLKRNFSRIRKWFYFFAGTAITIILLSWAFSGVSPGAVLVALQQARWEWLFLGWLAYLASYWVRAWRWGTLLAVSGNPGRFWSRLAAIFIGFGANSVLPAYTGEFFRAAALCRLDQVAIAAVIGSIFAERLLDLGVVFVFLLLPLLLPLELGRVPTSASLSILPLEWLGVGIVLVWAVLVIGASFPTQIAQTLGKIFYLFGLGKFKARIIAITSGFFNGLLALRQPQTSLLALLETTMVWGLNAITYWAGLVAFGILSPGFAGAVFTQSATALAIAVPATPGYIGPFEAGIRFSLGLYAVPVNLTIAYALALRFLMYVTIPIMAGAMLILWKFNQKLVQHRQIKT